MGGMIDLLHAFARNTMDGLGRGIAVASIAIGAVTMQLLERLGVSIGDVGVASASIAMLALVTYGVRSLIRLSDKSVARLLTTIDSMGQSLDRAQEEIDRLRDLYHKERAQRLVLEDQVSDMRDNNA